MRSRPQEGQNFDLPVISLPQREQNMRASYAAARLSQAETRGVSRDGLRKAGGQRGRWAVEKSGTTFEASADRRSQSSPNPERRSRDAPNFSCGASPPPRGPAAPPPLARRMQPISPG